MHKYLVFLVLLGGNQLIQSSPQSFSQSFSSSNVVKPNGEIVSGSIYTNSQGKSIVNGVNLPSKSVPLVPSLYTFLIPPGDPNGLPYIIETDDQQTPPPVPKPPSYREATTATTTIASTLATTEKPRIIVTTRVTTKVINQSTFVQSLSTTSRPIPTIRLSSPSVTRPTTKTSFINNRQSTSLIGKRNDGSYIHDKSGQYKPDQRGQYRVRNNI